MDKPLSIIRGKGNTIQMEESILRILKLTRKLEGIFRWDGHVTF